MLQDALRSMERARDLTVDHSLVPAVTRAQVDAAFNRLEHDAGVMREAAATVDRVIRFRLGTNNVCPECGAGTVDPDEARWHYEGCSLAGG